MVKEGLKAATFKPQVWDDLEYIRRTRGYRSIAETIKELAAEAIAANKQTTKQQSNRQITGRASATKSASYAINQKGVSREGFEPPELIHKDRVRSDGLIYLIINDRGEVF